MIWWHKSAAPETGAEAVDPLLWGWSDEIPDQAIRQVARVTLPLLLDPHRWIHRRVERIQFIDRQTIRRHVSVDFTPPTGMTPVNVMDRPTYAVPLFLLRRDHPRPFRVGKPKPWWTEEPEQYRARMPMSLFSDLTFTEQHGTHIPLITRRESTRLASAFLRRATSQTTGRQLSERELQDLSAVALSDRQGRKEALQRLLVKRPSGPRELTLLGESPVADLICMMATCLPIMGFFETQPVRSIATLSYVEPLEDDPATSRWSFPRSMGWKSENLAVAINEIGAAASHHIEIEVPEDLQVNYVSLAGKGYTQANRAWHDLADHEKDYSIRQVGTSNSGNFYLSDLPYARRMGRISIKMRVRRSRFLMGALVASAIITAVLFVLSQVAGAVLKAEASDALVAALLLLPSVVATYIARPGEHVITARMLRWARFSLVANAALPYLAVVAFLTTGSQGPGLHLGGVLESVFSLFSRQDSPANGLEARWLVLACCSFVLTCLFIASNIWPRPHGESQNIRVPGRI